MKELISTGSPFEAEAGYSRAVVQGDWCFLAGTTGYDYQSMIMPDTVEDQTRAALSTIETTLKKAGFSLEDVVQIRYYLADRAYVAQVFPILGETFGEIRPAAVMVACSLCEPEMKIEIEATAFRG